MIYFISNNGVQKGPLTFEQLKEQEINNKTLVWKEGTSDWVKASEVEELVAVLELMPPPVDAVLAGTALDVRENASEAEVQDIEVMDAAQKLEVRDDDAANEEVEAQSGIGMQEMGVEDTPRKVIDNTRMFSHFLTFRGRSRCAEYWIVRLVDKGLSFVIDFDDLTVWMFLLIFFDMYVVLTTGVRRCHDRGHSGFYILIPLYAFYLLFAGSVPGDNKYGNNPKGENFKKLY